MKDDTEIKKMIIEALNLVPDDVERIDLVIRLRGQAGTVAITYSLDHAARKAGLIK